MQGAGEGSARATVWVGDVDTTGSDRREMYIDARDIQPDEDKGETTTSESYLQRLADRGGQKLLAQLRTGSIEFDVDDDALQVGDVLSASLPQLGYTAMVRVADIITQSQDSGTTRTIRLGTPAGTKRKGGPMSDIITYPENGITYDADDASGYLATRQSGVYSAEEDFAVSISGELSLTVSAGQAWVRPSRFKGRSIIMEQPTTLTLTAADPVRTRIDRVVLRYDAAARQTRLQVLEGTPDSASPTAPAYHPHGAGLRPLPCRDHPPCRLHGHHCREPHRHPRGRRRLRRHAGRSHRHPDGTAHRPVAGGAG